MDLIVNYTQALGMTTYLAVPVPPVSARPSSPRPEIVQTISPTYFISEVLAMVIFLVDLLIEKRLARLVGLHAIE